MDFCSIRRKLWRRPKLSGSPSKLRTKKTPIAKDYDLSRTAVGEGANGKVVIVTSKTTGKKFALKILRDNASARVEVELQYKAGSVSDHIVKIVDVYENTRSGRRCLMVVMELMDGGELFDRVKDSKSPVTERQAADYVRQICSAVSHLHELNIAHRDLKPENLLLTDKSPSALVKLTDFGFAKEVAANGMETPCYTPYYVAPEILGPDKYHKSCDVWSLGVITYIVLCGYPPFYSKSGAPISPGMKRRIRDGTFKFPDGDWSSISSQAKDLITNMLRTNPEERLTVEEVLAHAWITGDGVEHKTEPLPSARILTEEKEVWQGAQDELDSALASMRIDHSPAQGEQPVRVKEMAVINNPMLERRKVKQEAFALPHLSLHGVAEFV